MYQNILKKVQFPNFLKIATIPKTGLYEVNKTLVEKQFQERAEEMLIKIFAEKLAFSFQLVNPGDKQYGTRLPEGNWTGMVGLLQRKEADVIFHKLTITEERVEVMDYSYPYYIDHMVFATKNFELTVNPDTFLKPFNAYVWITFVACFFIMPIVFTVLFKRKYFLRSLVACEFFGKLPELVVRKYSECILKLSWEIAMLFFRWSYIALVLSFLTFPTLTGVRTIAELANAIQEGRYQCTAPFGTYLTKAFIKSGGYSSIVGKNLIDDEGTLDFEGALQKTGLSKKIAVIAGDSDLLHLKEKYFVSEDEFFHMLYVIGVSKDFCCKDQLDFIVNSLWSSGIYLHLLKHGLLIEEQEILKRSSFDAKHESRERSLSFDDLEGVFILLAFGYALAIIVFVIEIIHSKCRYV